MEPLDRNGSTPRAYQLGETLPDKSCAGEYWLDEPIHTEDQLQKFYGVSRSRTYEYSMRTTRLVLTVMTLFAADTNAGTQERLAACRQQIDSLDQRIVELFQQRARMVQEVGIIKHEAHLPVTTPSRERQVVEKAQELAKGGPLPAETVGRIYRKLVEEMRNWEADLDAAAPRSPSQSPATGDSE